MITVHTKVSGPTLMKKLRSEIDAGDIRTWKIDAAGDLKHTKSGDNVQAAWFLVTACRSSVEFVLVPIKDAPSLDDFSKAYHHGKLVQMLLDHFWGDVKALIATP